MKNKKEIKTWNKVKDIWYWNISREPENTVDISESENGEIGHFEENFRKGETGTLTVGFYQTCHNWEQWKGRQKTKKWYRTCFVYSLIMKECEVKFSV